MVRDPCHLYSLLQHYSFYAVAPMYASQFSDLVLSQQCNLTESPLLPFSLCLQTQYRNNHGALFWVPSPAKVDWTYVAKQVANLFVQCSEIRMSVPPSFDLRFTSGINVEAN